MAGKRFDWKGEQLKAKIRNASIDGVNEVLASCTLHTKQNHPGWQNRTGTAERSVQVQQPARVKGRGVAGTWGSRGTNYMLVLEYKHGSALRNAADARYPELPGAISRRLT